jgi:glycosyltransferase involved in cell wall biosynthesis
MAMRWEPLVSIVVPCYNVERSIARCAQSLLALSYSREKFEIIFVDDGSTDLTGTILKQYQDQLNVQVIRHSSNRGLAASRNTGILQASDSEVVCFLDGDMVVFPDWLNNMLNVLQQDNVIGVVGDSCLPRGIKPNSLDRYFYSYLRGARRFGEGIPIHFPYFLFNNTALRRFALNRVGLFDETFTVYGGEDTDMAIRLWKMFPEGFRFSREAVSEHYHQRTLEQFCRSMEDYGCINLPRLIQIYPKYQKQLAGKWLTSLSGYLLFNSVITPLIKIIHDIVPFPLITRYLVVASVVKGYRNKP